jgi:hypothetical protein
MSRGTPVLIHRDLGYIGAHAFLLAGAIGLLFLQRYIWVLKIAEQGFGPYQTVSYLVELSVLAVVVDALVLRWTLRGSPTIRRVSLLWPALCFGSALFIVLVNNV